LHVLENGEICLNLNNINAYDEDTEYDKITFEVVQKPRAGKITVGGKTKVTRFNFQCFVLRE
jgi:hypothetical protein